MVEILKLMLGRDSEDEIWSRFVFELVICPNRLLRKDELNPRVRCAFGNVSFLFHSHGHLNFSFKIVSGRPSSGEMVCGKADKIGGGSSGGRLRGLFLPSLKSSVLKVN